VTPDGIGRDAPTCRRQRDAAGTVGELHRGELRRLVAETFEGEAAKRKKPVDA
jgi:hypothetical protein